MVCCQKKLQQSKELDLILVVEISFFYLINEPFRVKKRTGKDCESLTNVEVEKMNQKSKNGMNFSILLLR